jgi:hypothetical protein
MSNISTNALGLSSLIATIILLLFKVEIDTAAIDVVIAGVLAFYGLYTTIRNQMKRSDISNFFLRK